MDHKSPAERTQGAGRHRVRGEPADGARLRLYTHGGAFVNALHGAHWYIIDQGTDDLFLPDTRLLGDRVRAAGGRVVQHETPGGFHVFMGAPFLPEAREVYRRIAEHLGTPRP